MEQVTLTVFTDPMMGLSYESEPILRALETHFPGQIAIRYAMSWLVRDVRQFMSPEELSCDFPEGLRRYHKRLARIYESEEAIGGLPIAMPDLCLFSEAEPSTLPLNLACHAARLADGEKAERFLYRLRYATIVERRTTTDFAQLRRVAEETGIDADTFERHYRDGSARQALEQDLRLGQQLGIRALPAYLAACGERATVFQSFRYDDFVSAIYRVSGGTVQPRRPVLTPEALARLLETHPLISPIEVCAAFELDNTEAVREAITPLLAEGIVSIIEVPHGWFIRRNAT